MKIVLATSGSLGDLHPKIALGIELRRRGHEVAFCTWQGYAETITGLGFAFYPLRPDVDPTDRELLRDLMDARKGSEKVIRELIFPFLREMYDDVGSACRGADVLVTGELIYIARTLAEATGIKWVSTSLAPLTMFSAEDPNVYPTAEWIEYLRPMPAAFHRAMFAVMRTTVAHWFKPYKDFRRGFGLNEGPNPVFEGKFSPTMHLAMFSRVIGAPQSDWPKQTVQTGFCFYDGAGEDASTPAGLQEFLDRGDAPIVFTLGSAAVMDPRDFFDESVKTARLLGRRGLLLYGIYNDAPAGLDEHIAGFDYAPYSAVFPHAACVVHQGGVGTTSQVLRAGVPHLIMPYGHDQPDNAARCRRIGVAEIISRNDYNATSASRALEKILAHNSYRESAAAVAAIMSTETGTSTACDAIERVLLK